MFYERRRERTKINLANLSTEPDHGQFGTLEPADVKRLRQLEQENARLKKMVADRELEIDVLKDITRKKW